MTRSSSEILTETFVYLLDSGYSETAVKIAGSIGASTVEVEKALESLQWDGRVQVVREQGKTLYRADWFAKATAVYVADGSTENHDGDEIRVWDVFLGDDDGEPVSDRADRTHQHYSFDSAVRYADWWGEKLNLEVVTD